MATQIEILSQITELLTQQNKLLTDASKLTKSQADFTKELATALKGISFKETASEIQDVVTAVDQASTATKTFGSTNQDVFQKVNKAIAEASDKQEEMNEGIAGAANKLKKLSITSAALDGMIQGFKFSTNAVMMFVSAAKTLITTIGHVGASILAIPFKMLNGLINMATQGGGDTGIRQALEDIRKEFGALHATSGKAIVSMARSMRGELAQTGLSTWRIFGNLAEKLKTVTEYAKNLGPLFATLAGQFVQNAEAIGAFYKGLGLTAEAQKAVATRAFATGTAVTEELREIANYSLQMSKAFNGTAGSSKEISRDMGTLMVDFKHFGGIATKEIAQSVVYFRRLGIEVSKVLGVLDKYDNFEDAAMGAANLSQAFNMNVSALEMMKAQNPAQRVELLRKAFFAAGRSIEGMTRQERALLAQQSGLDDSTLDLTFSSKNQALSYDQVTKKAGAAQKAQMTQTQAMKALADSIERLVKSGSFGHGGFIDRFIQGFDTGVQRGGVFRRMMWDIRRDLQIAYYEGIRAGRAFETMFPAIQSVFKAIRNIFDPTKFRQMFRNVVLSFKQFYNDMTKNPETALPNLIKHLKENFFSWFDANSENGKTIIEGFKSFFKNIGIMAGSLLREVIPMLTKGIRFVVDLITGNKKLSDLGIAAQGSAALGFLSEVIKPIVSAIKTFGPELWATFKKLLTTVWNKAKVWFSENAWPLLKAFLAPVLAGMTGQVAVVLLARTIGSLMVGGLKHWAASGGIQKAWSGVKGLFMSEADKIAQSAQGLTVTRSAAPTARIRGASPAAAAIGEAEEAAEAANQAGGNGISWTKVAAIAILIGGFIVVLIEYVMPAIGDFAKEMQKQGISGPMLKASALAVAALGLTISAMAVAAAVVIKAAETVSWGAVGKAAVGLLAIGAVSLAMIGVGKLAVMAFGNVDPAKLAAAAAMMTALGVFFGVAALVTLAAAAVGALVATGYGVIAIAAGLAAIGTTIKIMAEGAIKIMDQIDKFNPGPEFIGKARVFIEIIKGISSFAGNIASLTEATRPSFFSFISAEEQQQATIGTVSDLIRIMGLEIQAVLLSIENAVSDLSNGESKLRAAQVLVSILGGISELAKNLQPPTAVFEQSGWFVEAFGRPELVSDKIKMLKDYMKEVLPELGEFLRTVVNGVINGVSGFTPEQQRATQAIPGMLGGLATFVSAVQQGAITLSNTQVSGRTTPEEAFRRVEDYTNSVIRTIGVSTIFQEIGTFLRDMALSLGGLNSAQLRSLEGVIPLIAPMFTILGNLTEILVSFKNQLTGTPEEASRAVVTINQIMNIGNQFFAAAQVNIPSALTAMRRAMAGMSSGEVSNLVLGMKAMAEIFKAMGTLPELLNSIRGLDSHGSINDNIDAMFGAFNTTLRKLGYQFAASDTINGGNLRMNFNALIPNLTSFSSEIKNSAFHRASKAVTDMITEVNALAVAINSADAINIDASLQHFGDMVGLGHNGTYTITARNFTTTVNVNIKFDNDALDAMEMAMLHRTTPAPGGSRFLPAPGRH